MAWRAMWNTRTGNGNTSITCITCRIKIFRRKTVQYLLVPLMSLDDREEIMDIGSEDIREEGKRVFNVITCANKFLFFYDS